MRESNVLSLCLMDSDAEMQRGRRARLRRALLMAIAFQAVLVAWLLLWPILTPGGSPPSLVFVPRISVGIPAIRPPVKLSRPEAVRTVSFASPVFERPRIARRPLETNSEVSAIDAPPAWGMNSHELPGDTSGVPSALSGSNWNISPPQPPRIVRKSEGVQSGMLIHRVDPRYPELAKIAHVSGTVELRAIIGRDGAIRSIEVLSGSPLLARAAVGAVWHWRYRPTFLNGQPVEVETQITVNFVMHQ